MHQSTLFYTGNLSIHGFGCPLEALKPIPLGYRGTPGAVKFLESQELYSDFQLCRGGQHPLPHVVQESPLYC